METASLSLAQPQTFGSTEETARGIAPILKQGFGLPLPKRVNVFVYPGVSPSSAASSSRKASARYTLPS